MVGLEFREVIAEGEHILVGVVQVRHLVEVAVTPEVHLGQAPTLVQAVADTYHHCQDGDYQDGAHAHEQRHVRFDNDVCVLGHSLGGDTLSCQRLDVAVWVRARFSSPGHPHDHELF